MNKKKARKLQSVSVTKSEPKSYTIELVGLAVFLLVCVVGYLGMPPKTPAISDAQVVTTTVLPPTISAEINQAFTAQFFFPPFNDPGVRRLIDRCRRHPRPEISRQFISMAENKEFLVAVYEDAGPSQSTLSWKGVANGETQDIAIIGRFVTQLFTDDARVYPTMGFAKDWINDPNVSDEDVWQVVFHEWKHYEQWRDNRYPLLNHASDAPDHQTAGEVQQWFESEMEAHLADCELEREIRDDKIYSARCAALAKGGVRAMRMQYAMTAGRDPRRAKWRDLIMQLGQQ